MNHQHPQYALLLLAVVALSLYSPAAAQTKLRGWQMIAETESGITQYLDMDRLKKEKGYARIRTLTDYKTPVWSVTSKRIYSEVDEIYVDCKNRKTALLATASYECRMARCAPKEDYKYDATLPEFGPIPKHESLASNLYSIACQP